MTLTQVSFIISNTNSSLYVQYQPRYSYLVLKDDRFLDTIFLFLSEK